MIGRKRVSVDVTEVLVRRWVSLESVKYFALYRHCMFSCPCCLYSVYITLCWAVGYLYTVLGRRTVKDSCLPCRWSVTWEIRHVFRIHQSGKWNGLLKCWVLNLCFCDNCWHSSAVTAYEIANDNTKLAGLLNLFCTAWIQTFQAHLRRIQLFGQTIHCKILIGIERK